MVSPLDNVRPAGPATGQPRPSGAPAPAGTPSFDQVLAEKLQAPAAPAPAASQATAAIEAFERARIGAEQIIAGVPAIRLQLQRAHEAYLAARSPAPPADA